MFSSVVDTSSVHAGGAVEINPAAYASGYDALKNDGQRKSVAANIMPEWRMLGQQQRERLTSNTYDLYRNSVLTAWALRRHIDHICSWKWRPNTGDRGLDKDLKELMDRDSRPYGCDAGGRHSWARILRLSELQTQLAGDCFHVPLRSGLVQSVESNFCRNPGSSRRDANRWRLGCKLGTANRTVAFCMHEQDIDGKARERILARSRVWHHACMDFRFNQIRGISPITAAINGIRDFEETDGDIRSKLKMEAILGVAFFQGMQNQNVFTGTPQHPTPETGASPEPKLPPFFDIGKGAVGFGMKQGESIETFGLKNPSTETQDYLKLSIMICLKAFDLPFNFFDESNANFFSSRGAWQGYETSCIAKRENIRELNRLYTLWRTIRWIMPKAFGGTGEIVLPRGKTLDNLQGTWIPRATPWWKPQEELTTDLMLVASGMMTFQQMCDKRGFGIWDENVVNLADELKTAQEAGLAMVFNQGKLPVSIRFNADLPPETESRLAA